MRWAEILIQTPPDSSEAVSAHLLEAGCSGVAEHTGRPGVLTGYLPASDSFHRTLESLQERLRALSRFGLPPAGGITVRWVEDADWANAWKAHFKPLEVGRRLVIKPSWETYTGDRLVVELDPGMAFGTGAHPSTRLCLEALEEWVFPGSAVADIGTGSGILAIAAAALGAGRVEATDIDSLPRRIAQENVDRAGFSHVIHVREIDSFDREARDCDIVVANIVADTIIELTPAIPARLKAGGIFIAAGIVEERLADVETALAAAGLALQEVRADDIWRLTIARKAGAPQSLARG